MKRQLPLLLTTVLLTACSSQTKQDTPVGATTAPAPVPAAQPAETTPAVADPYAAAVAPAAPEPETPIETEEYLIQPGDSLWKIANERNTSVRRLMSINKMQKNAIRAGNTLLVPKMAQPAAPAPAAPATP